MGAALNRRVFINEAFRPQRISGQQRYATEVSDRLPASYTRVTPTGVWASSKVATWLWVQTILPLRTWRGVLISMTARAPIWHPRHVVVIHDLFVIEHPEWFSKKYHLTHAPLQKLQMAHSAGIVCVSEPVAAEIADAYGVDAAVAPNAPSSVFDGIRSGDRDLVAGKRLAWGEYIVSVGSLEPRKNLVRLARAYAELDEATRRAMPLVIVGGTADVYSQSDVEWPEGTILAGYVSDDELRALYAGALAMVFVSKAEGFGLPIVEAALAGAPRMVLSDIPVFRWIAGASAQYVDPESVTDIASALGRLLDTPESSFEELKTRFSWEATATTIGEVATRAGASS